MIRGQAERLHATGLALLDKAAEAGKASDVQKFTALGVDCLAESRKILESLRYNSILIFLECNARAGALGNYGHYLDFCARNSLDTLAQEDFEEVCKGVVPSTQKSP